MYVCMYVCCVQVKIRNTCLKISHLGLCSTIHNMNILCVVSMGVCENGWGMRNEAKGCTYFKSMSFKSCWCMERDNLWDLRSYVILLSISIYIQSPTCTSLQSFIKIEERFTTLYCCCCRLCSIHSYAASRPPSVLLSSFCSDLNHNDQQDWDCIIYHPNNQFAIRVISWRVCETEWGRPEIR